MSADLEAGTAQQVVMLRIEMAKFGVKLDNMVTLDKKVDDVTKVADLAEKSASSAHKRINEMVVTQRWIIGLSIPTLLGLVGLVYNMLK